MEFKGRDVDKVFDTVKRSIMARGGLGEYERVREALVWNFYKKLSYKERKEIGLAVEVPAAWDASGWMHFKRNLSKNSRFAALTQEAEDILQFLIRCDRVLQSTVHINGKAYTMLSLRGTLISVGSSHG